MIRLYAGADTFASYHACLNKAEELAQAQQAQIVKVDADELSLDAFADLVQQQGFFSTKQVVVAKRLLDNRDLAKFLAEHWDNYSQQEVLIWQPAEADQRLALVKKATQAKTSQLFALPRDWEIVEWVKQQASELKLPLPARLQQSLVEMVGADKWRLQQELIKLQLSAQAGKELNQELLEDLIVSTTELQIWELLDALGAKNKAKVLKLWQAFNAQEDTVPYILTMFGRELTLLAQVIYAEQNRIALSTLGMKDFVLRKLQTKSRQFTWQKLQKLASALVRLDLAVKRGKIEPDTAVFLYLLSW